MTAPAETSQREALIESLWRDARREGDEILRQAAEEAERVRAQARADAEAAIRDGREQARARAAPEAARIVNRSRREGEREVLASQMAVLEEVFSEACSRIASLSRAEEDACTGPLLAEALSEIPPGTPLQVVCRPGQAAACKRTLASQGLVAEVTVDDSLPVGVKVLLDGGKEVRDNTLPARLAMLREDPPLSLLSGLFAGKG